jgi:hypothetical protein
MQANQLNNSKKMYPISVEYVFETDYDPKDPCVKLVIDYCKMMEIKFRARKYDSINIEEDKTLIEKLPAIHIYIKNVHRQITYPDNDSLTPLYTIRNVYDAFDIEYMSYISKKQIWYEKLNFLKRMFLKNSSKTDCNVSSY